MAELFNYRNFSVGVGSEAVDSNDNGDTELLHIFNVSEQVNDALFKSFNIFLCKLCLRHAAVVLEGTDSCNDNSAVGGDTAETALDVAELFSAKVSAEACLGDAVIAKLKSKLCCSYGVAAVGNVCERTAVHKYGVISRV